MLPTGVINSIGNLATKPNDRERASFLKENIVPIKESGQLQFITVTENDIGETTATPISKNFSVKTANGHTGAMMLPVIKYNDKTIVYMADLLPSVAHIPLPYVMGYDMFPLTTLNEKKIFLIEALENNYTLFF